MRRYFFYFSYIGTRFSGLSKQSRCQETQLPEPYTIQGEVEKAIETLNPICDVHVYPSSRTDKGVHAIRSSFHTNLEFLHPDFNPKYLLVRLNKYFEKENIPIRLQSCQFVPETFSARHSAKSRSYLYRLAVRRPDAPQVDQYRKYVCETPIEEWNRCYFIHYPKFDVERMKSVLPLFEGVRDYKTFSCFKRSHRPLPPTVRQLDVLEITEGKSLISQEYSPYARHYDFYDIKCKSRSFIYKQIRKIVGALVGVGLNIISGEDIQRMFDEPAFTSWPSPVELAPPCGLYLLDVEYDPEDMKMPQVESVNAIHPLSRNLLSSDNTNTNES